MDMWGPYIAATLEMIPEALKKIAFDRFHVAKHLGDAVDKVRRAEHRALLKEGNEILTGTRYQWLKGRGRKTHREKLAFARLRAGTRRTAQAWELKEAAANLWRYKSRSWAIAGWNPWLDWASRCRLDPVLKAARMVREHLWGIVNAVISGATNGARRRHQQPDQDGQGAQPRLPQPGTLRERHPLPSRRPRSLPRWPPRLTSRPPEMGKNPKGVPPPGEPGGGVPSSCGLIQLSTANSV